MKLRTSTSSLQQKGAGLAIRAFLEAG